MIPQEEESFEQDLEILRGQVLEFLSEFEVSEETEEDMKTILPIWRDEIINHARCIGGGTLDGVNVLMRVCEDFASHRGMLERVKKEAEEIRLQLGL